MRGGKKLALVMLAGIAAPSLAADTGLRALANVATGAWTLRPLDGSGGGRSLCIADARQFLQLHHPRQNCTTRVIEDGPGAATVQYRCRATGYGRTAITVEGPRLLTLDTQGLAGGAPFDERYEARLQGACVRR